MSHKASPWENGDCESWVKTLKYRPPVEFE
jgi:hypothetical protein